MFPKENSQKYARLAADLAEICRRPENTGKQWTWMRIATALNISIGEARTLILWMRKYYTGGLWTVGVAASGYRIMLTNSMREALPGLVNQLKHITTRLHTMHQMAETLELTDPDPDYSRLAGSVKRRFTRWADDVEDFVADIQRMFG